MSSVPVMGGGALDLLALAEAALAQPELFGPANLPVETPVVAAARNYCHTGRITGRDEARALTIAAVYLRTESKRLTAKLCGCSRYTPDAVMLELEEGGCLPHVKDRLHRLMANFALEAVEWSREIIASRVISSETASMLKATAVAVGVGSDKMLAQQNGDFHVHQHLHMENQRPAAEVAAEWARMVKGTVEFETTTPAA